LEAVRERAALYVLGGLTPDEMADIERRLADGDARYHAEVAACRAVANDLAYAAVPVSPPPQARARVLARIAAAADAPGVIEQDGFRFVLGSRLAWGSGVAPGIEYKLLRRDAVNGRRTGLIRMAPGAVFPKHRHPETEEVLVLEGDLLINGVLMSAGDYCTAEGDSVHDGVVSPSGCVFVVTAGANEFF
ncbi:MAG: cupin domain-containing protein, partial [bacterium]